MANQVYTPLNITGIATTVVKNKQGILGGITINTPAAGTITIYDSTTASGTKIGTIAASSTGGFTYDSSFINGLTIVTAAATDLTVRYQ